MLYHTTGYSCETLSYDMKYGIKWDLTVNKFKLKFQKKSPNLLIA